MQAKKIVCFFGVLILFLGLICSVDALPDTTVSFRGGGVTVDLTFPEEAHPLDNIMHDFTITANKDMILQNFTVSIKAPANSGWQEIRKREELGQNLSQNTPWAVPLSMSLPQDANGTLSCFIYILTNQTTEPLIYTFFTTRVSELTFSEMQSLYNEMLANYTTLQADYETLINEYNDLSANCTSLLANYTALLSEHNQLTADYNSKVAAYETLLAQYNTLSGDYSSLDSDYKSQRGNYNALQSAYALLNSTRYSLQANYTSLQAVYDTLNQTYTELGADLNDLQQRITDSESALGADRIVMFIFIVAVACLIAFIIYIKRKETEPYVVIRKETVAVKSDEKS